MHVWVQNILSELQVVNCYQGILCTFTEYNSYCTVGLVYMIPYKLFLLPVVYAPKRNPIYSEGIEQDRMA